MEKESGYEIIAPLELKKWIDERRDFLLIDTLPQEVFKKRRIPRAESACVYEVSFPDQVGAIAVEKERRLVVYGSSHRSRDAVTAAEKLVRLGYRNVYALSGGVLGWQAEGFALVGEEVEAAIDPGTHLNLVNGTYPIDPEVSVVAWMGRNANTIHTGTVGLAGGEIAVEGGLLSGIVEADMDSIRNIDLEGNELQSVLIAHLKSEDFFFVKSFPQAKFFIQIAKPVAEGYLSSPNYEVEGSFELCGVRRDIHFLATLSNLADGRIAAEAHFDLDRTWWNVLYGSSRFFEHLGMHLVFDPITIQLRIVAG
jgi:rhodanese-related sulfurtransferase/polyisoprenoid-binding protein YceI